MQSNELEVDQQPDQNHVGIIYDLLLAIQLP